MKASRIFSFIALLLVGILLAACGENKISVQPSSEVSLQTASSADISSVAETAASPSSAEQPSSTKQPTSEEAVVTTVPSEETTTPDDAVESVFLWEKNDTGITITRYTGRDPRPVVPAVIDGLPVTVLKAPFESKEGLETVTLPASLQSVKLGWIKDNSLKAVYFEGTLEDWCRIDFQDGGVRRNWNSTLKLYINGEAVKDVTIPEGTTVVNNYLFAGCETLERVVLPDSVKEIGMDAFSGCFNLRSVNMPENLTTIDYGAFERCASLTDVVFPEHLTVISDSAFENCAALTGIVVPDSVEYVGCDAFGNCENLRSIALGKSFCRNYYGEEDDEYAGGMFAGCPVLESITVSKDNTLFRSSGNCLIDTKHKRLLAGGCNAVIPSDGSVTEIYFSAFNGRKALTSITIPKSVTKIYEAAFGGCEGLTSVVIPDKVTTIGSEAFKDCTGLTNVKIGSGVKVIGSEAFENCTALESIVIPDSVCWTHGSAFKNCTSLRRAVIGKSLMMLWGMFDHCTSLESVVIPKGLLIEEEDFFGCSINKVYFRGTKEEWQWALYVNPEHTLRFADVTYNYKGN